LSIVEEEIIGFDILEVFLAECTEDCADEAA